MHKPSNFVVSRPRQRLQHLQCFLLATGGDKNMIVKVAGDDIGANTGSGQRARYSRRQANRFEV